MDELQLRGHGIIVLRLATVGVGRRVVPNNVDDKGGAFVLFDVT